MKHWVNLTNGLLYLEELPSDVHFTRIQSTTLESKNWIKLFSDLDHNFLLHLALGYECMLYDCGCNKTISRTIYQGIPVIKYVLDRYWYDKIETPYIIDRTGKVTKKADINFFNSIYEFLFCYNSTKEKEAVKVKLKYYKKFLNSTEVHLKGISKCTDKDGNYEYFVELLKNYKNERS